MSFGLWKLVGPLCLGAALCGLTGLNANAQAKPHSTPPTLKKCEGGGSFRLSAASAIQGAPLTFEATLPVDAASVNAEWNDREVPLWPVAKKPGVFRGLMGIDLETAPGEYAWKLTAKTAAGESISCEGKLTVRPAKFATERLTVDNQYVEPNPEQEKRAAAEQEKMHAIYETRTPEKLWQGAFRIPLKGVTTGGNFGRRRVLNGKPRSPHTGVDFPAAAGTPVYAAQSGRVVLAEALYYPGNTVIIDHGLGVYTFYCHLSQIDASVGAEVKAGEEIGKVGATGRVTGPHLHWGVTIDKARVNGVALAKLQP